MKELTHTCHYKLYAYEELCETDRQLVDAAKQATQGSYAPYSEFHVGAAALLADGAIVSGSNQENAAYPSGLCAERTTLFYANAAHPNQAIKALAVAAYTNGKFTNIPVPPCGACRQALLDAERRQGSPLRIIMAGAESATVVESAQTLLPFTFKL